MLKNKKIFITLILIFMLVIPTGLVFADDGSPADPPAPAEDPAPPEDPSPEAVAASSEVGVQCEGTDCEVLPSDASEESQVDAIVNVASAIPNTENGGMILDLSVNGETFDDVPAACANEEDSIYIGQDTPGTLGLITDVTILNAIAAEYGIYQYTETEAYIIGTQIDDAFAASIVSGEYDHTIDLIRAAVGNVVDESIEWTGGDNELSSFWFSTNNESLQSLVIFVQECIKEGKDPKEEIKKIRHLDTGGDFF